MTCHYSCASCSSKMYSDLCLTCPVSRYLMDTTCLCNPGYYEYQSSNCLDYNSIDKPDYTFNVILQLFFFIMLGFSWLFILCNINHLYSPKIRVLITFSQLLSLLLDYRFRFTSISEKALNVFSVWNFNYFNTIFCTSKSKPYQCSSYENLYGPLLTLGSFLCLLVISYFMTKTCILSIFSEQQKKSNQQQVIIINRNKEAKYLRNTGKNQRQESSISSMSFCDYVSVSIKSFFLLYIDYSIIQWTVQLSRITYFSSTAFLIYIPILLFLICYILQCLSTINSISQFKIQYRSQLGYFYLYDQNYHLNYLDYLYRQQRSAKKDESHQNERFYPHSNYIPFQIIAKFCFAFTTIVMFQYKPQLWAFPILFAMLLVFSRLQVFYIYQRLALLIYFVGFLIYTVSLVSFYTPYFFSIWMVIIVFMSTAAYFFILISDLSDWSRQKQGKYWTVAFQYLHGQTMSEDQQNKELQNHLQSQHEQSNDDLIKSKISSFKDDIINEQNINLNLSKRQQNPASSQNRSILAKSKLKFKKASGASDSNSVRKDHILNVIPVVNNRLQVSKNQQISEKNNEQLLSVKQQQKQSFMSKSISSKFGVTKNKGSNSNQEKNNFMASNRISNKQQSNAFKLSKQLPDIQQEQNPNQDDNEEDISIVSVQKDNKSDDNLVISGQVEGRLKNTKSKFHNSKRQDRNQ